MLLTLLGILFIALKLTGVITWAWWLVLAPVWGQIVLLLLWLTVVVVGTASAATRSTKGWRF